MGGINQNVCPPPVSATPNGVRRMGAVRYHENTTTKEVHFHDDVNGIKCAIPTPVFVSAYHAWRQKTPTETLELIGHDGSQKPKPTAVKFVPFIDNAAIQVGIEVMALTVGDKLTDLDVLAGYK